MIIKPFFLIAVGLFFVGIAGAFVRRNVLAIAMCLEVAFLGVLFGIALFASQSGSLKGVSVAIVLLFISAPQILVLVATGVAAYRRRGSVTLDEFRELRG